MNKFNKNLLRNIKNSDPLDYDDKGRFASYWHQIHEIAKLNPHSILEIGKGNGFLSDYLKKWGYNIVTIDVERNLDPDIVGNIRTLPFKDNTFEVVVSFQVLEHLPFNYFRSSLNELKRVSKKYILISLPDISKVYKVLVSLPIFGKVRWLIPIPVLFKPEKPNGLQHYWEIGMKNYSLKFILDCIIKSDLTLQMTYRVFEKSNHRLFVLKINKSEF